MGADMTRAIEAEKLAPRWVGIDHDLATGVCRPSATGAPAKFLRAVQIDRGEAFATADPIKGGPMVIHPADQAKVSVFQYQTPSGAMVSLTLGQATSAEVSEPPEWPPPAPAPSPELPAGSEPSAEPATAEVAAGAAEADTNRRRRGSEEPTP